jgi:outer membrane protein assembly factor BamD
MRPFFLAFLLAALTACASGGPRPQSYADEAQFLYQEGEEALDDGDYQRAISLFEQVRARFPYSSWATEAELRTADTEFERERYPEAIDRYQTFAKLHPNHPRVDWAAYRAAESHFEAIPSGFFLFPAPNERDVTEAEAARRAFEDFLAAFGGSEYAPRAQEKLGQVLGLLARHENYDGDFYASRKKWAGAAGRYETALRRFPGSGYDAETTRKLVAAYRQLGEEVKARGAIERFLERHPEDPEAPALREQLREAR